MRKFLFGTLIATMMFSAMPASIPAMLQMPTADEAAEIEPRADVFFW